MAAQKQTQEELLARIDSFEERISRLEELIKSGARANSPAGRTSTSDDQEEDFTNPLSESKVFEHGLAWIGSAVLLLGMIFTMLFVNNAFGGVASFVLGICSAALTMFLSGMIKKTLSYMAFMFAICAHLLIYYALLRLHFFTDTPVIGNLWIVLFLLMVSIGYLFYKADEAKSQLMGFIAYTLLIMTALFADQTQVTLMLFAVGTGIVIYLLNRNGWETLLILSIFMVYTGHALWLIGNPLCGHPIAAVTAPQFRNCLNFIFEFC
jgi:hypothetical protein